MLFPENNLGQEICFNTIEPMQSKNAAKSFSDYVKRIFEVQWLKEFLFQNL